MEGQVTRNKIETNQTINEVGDVKFNVTYKKEKS